MNVLVTGANGFIGKNLCKTLETIRDGRNRTRNIRIDEIFECDTETSEEVLMGYCEKADFVFNLAGINRPLSTDEFKKGNRDFPGKLVSMLKKAGNCCPVMLASSIQASPERRFAESEYGKTKKAGEEIFFEHGKETGARVLVYRFPNVFGKWCRPNYNSVVATFCHNIANGLPITVNDPETELELLYIDDLVEEMLEALEGKEHRDEKSGFCFVPKTHKVSLGKIAELIKSFESQPKTLLIPEIPEDSFAKKLYSTYLSYLPKEKAVFDLVMNSDERGSFTEIIKTVSGGQFSVNVSKPGVTKGMHWHHSKWEIFIVVSGRAMIRERKTGTDEIIEFEVSGEKPQAVHMLPGYTHSIENLSKTENLVTFMWANENFDPQKPDTYFEKV